MSGFADWRAELHERLFDVVRAELERRGYPSDVLPTDGHRPDAIFRDGSGYWDLKTGRPNLTIERLSLEEYERIEQREDRPVYVIHANVDDPAAWSVDRPSSLRARQIGRSSYTNTGAGSFDTGLLIRRGGTLFRHAFPFSWELDEILRG